MRLRGIYVLLVLLLAGFWIPAYSVLITDADIVPTTGDEVQSGNGLLDFILFIEANGVGVAGNSTGSFNGDDANTDMPTGNGKPTSNESFITSIGEIRDFYRRNFPDGSGGSTISELVLFVDLNQVTGDDLYLDVLDIVRNYDQNFGDDRDNPALFDISSRLQNQTGAVYSGGTILAELDEFVPKTLPLNVQGAGWADYMIFTGINPFDIAFADADRILFHWESHGHSDGGETIFLSGSFDANVPEPSMVILASLSLGGLLLRRKRQA